MGTDDRGHTWRGLLLKRGKNISFCETGVNKEMIQRTEKNIPQTVEIFLRKGRYQVICYKNLQEMREKDTQPALKT